MYKEHLTVPNTCRDYKNFQKNIDMLYYWKGLELDITDFEYQHDPTASVETTPSETSNR